MLLKDRLFSPQAEVIDVKTINASLARHVTKEKDTETALSFIQDGINEFLLPENSGEWSRLRLIFELRLALEARRRIQSYKGKGWKAEFMRLLYPECKAANAKGFDDLLRRLTQGPWGCSCWQQDPELARLIKELRR